jgi:hypothetical protein
LLASSTRCVALSKCSLKRSHLGPMVRICLPPAASQPKLSITACSAYLMRVVNLRRRAPI